MASSPEMPYRPNWCRYSSSGRPGKGPTSDGLWPHAFTTPEVLLLSAMFSYLDVGKLLILAHGKPRYPGRPKHQGLPALP